MSKSQRDKNAIALNQKCEINYLKVIAREIQLKTVGMKGKLFVKTKDGFMLSSISVVKLNRLTRAVIKALRYNRIDPSKLESSDSVAKAVTLIIGLIALGILIGWWFL